MSDSKLNSLGFDDDDVLSNLDKLKAKYTAFTEEETEPAIEEEPEEEAFFSNIADIPEEQDIDEEPADDNGDIFFSSYGSDEEVTVEPDGEFDTSEFMNYETDHDIRFDEEPQEEEAYIEDGISEPYDADETDIQIDVAPANDELEDSDDEDFYNDLDDEEDDEFADLDDDDDIVRIDADGQEDSPFAAALKEASNQSEQVRKTKEKQKKTSVKKSDGKGKNRNKLLYIIIAVAVPILLWLTVFITDITLVSNWKTPFFCAKTYEYENGSRDYKGAFYQFQIHINEQGEVESVCLPWFVKGPNDSLK